jgi:hypothetical protein
VFNLGKNASVFSMKIVVNPHHRDKAGNGEQAKAESMKLKKLLLFNGIGEIVLRTMCSEIGCCEQLLSLIRFGSSGYPTLPGESEPPGSLCHGEAALVSKPAIRSLYIAFHGRLHFAVSKETGP